MQINVNASVEVTLTSTGAETYNNYVIELMRSNRRYMDEFVPKKKGDVLKTQLHELFLVFGNLMYIGNPFMPFENNIIRIIE